VTAHLVNALKAALTLTGADGAMNGGRRGSVVVVSRTDAREGDVPLTVEI
jgi:hypothetical protein